MEEVFIPEFLKFKEKGESMLPTFAYWDQLLDTIGIMLTFISAERESNWLEHSSASMLPHFFVCNRTNYARYATLYVLQMWNHLPEEAEKEFLSGNHTIKFTHHAFRGLWADMGVEMSVIKDTISEQGIDGFTLRGDAVHRWISSRSISGEYARSMKSQCGFENHDTKISFMSNINQLVCNKMRKTSLQFSII